MLWSLGIRSLAVWGFEVVGSMLYRGYLGVM